MIGRTHRHVYFRQLSIWAHEATGRPQGSKMRDLFFAKCPDLVNNSMGFSFSGFGGNGKGWSDASISSPKWHYTSR